MLRKVVDIPSIYSYYYYISRNQKHKSTLTCLLQASLQTDILRIPDPPAGHHVQLQEHGGRDQTVTSRDNTEAVQVPVHGSLATMSWFYVANLALSYAAALILALVFEAPFLNLQKILHL